VTTCVVLQPSYIPWRGYFHQIYKADLFIFYDDVQYDKHGWRNRNRIKTRSGSHWLTIPVLNKGLLSEHILIKNILIDVSKEWRKKHWMTIQQAYGKAPFFAQYESLVMSFYQQKPQYLADYTIELTVALARELGIKHTRFLRSSELSLSGSKTDRLISILQTLGCNHYISGPAAQDYLEEEKFIEAGVSLEYMNYTYPPYPQLHPPFDPHVSVLDLLFMTGPDAPRYIWEGI
jgi:hypothetical protein